MIYDLHYTPVLLMRESNRYIPAEAVYAVLEAKPTINKGLLEYAGAKAASVRRLKRTSAPVVHSDGVRPPKQLFPIMSGIVAASVGWSDGFGESFSRVIAGDALAGDYKLTAAAAYHAVLSIPSLPTVLSRLGAKQQAWYFFCFIFLINSNLLEPYLRLIGIPTQTFFGPVTKIVDWNSTRSTAGS